MFQAMRPSAPTPLMLVDDHRIFREGLVCLLRGKPDLRVAAQAADGATALDKLVQFKPAVVLVEVSLPDMTGAELTRRIMNRLPNTRVIALSTHAEPMFLHLMLEEGAAGYVLKNDAFDELVSTISRSLEQESRPPFLSRSAAAAVAHLKAGDSRMKKGTLSKREEQVLRMLADGVKNSEIADRLEISVKTVDTYRRRVMEKLGVRNGADLVKTAISLGLTDLA